MLPMMVLFVGWVGSVAGSCGYSGALTTRVLLLFWERPLNKHSWVGWWVDSPIPRHWNWKGLLGEQARNH